MAAATWMPDAPAILLKDGMNRLATGVTLNVVVDNQPATGDVGAERMDHGIVREEKTTLPIRKGA